jgi:hypothetical protein
MKKILVMLIATALLASLAGNAGGAPQLTRPKPVASVLFAPAVWVVGKRFKARERVKVSIISSTTWARTVRATKLGTFKIDFGGIALNDCNEFTLKIVGNLGSRFSLSHPAKPC